MWYLCNQHNYRKLPTSSALIYGPGPGMVNLVAADRAVTPNSKEPMLSPTNPHSKAISWHKLVKGVPDPNDPRIQMCHLGRALPTGFKVKMDARNIISQNRYHSACMGNYAPCIMHHASYIIHYAPCIRHTSHIHHTSCIMHYTSRIAHLHPLQPALNYNKLSDSRAVGGGQ